MFKIVSSVGRSWPAHDFHIPVGETDFEKLTEQQVYFLRPFVDAGLMVIVNDAGMRVSIEDPRDAGMSDEQRKARTADTVARIKSAIAAEQHQRSALDKAAKDALSSWQAAVAGTPEPDGVAEAKADAEAKAKAEAKRQADEADARAKADAEAKAKAEADAQAKGKKSGG